MRRVLVTLLAGLSCLSPAHSQDDSLEFASCLPVGKLLDLARVNAPNVQIAVAGIGEAEANVDAARALFKPQLSAFGRSGFGDTGITDSGVSNQLGLRASQRIYDFGDAKYARASAQAGLIEQQYRVQSEGDAARLSTLRAILDFKQAFDQSELTAERRQFFRQQKNLTQSLLEAGGATRTELANVSSRLAEAESFYEELEFIRLRAQTEIESITQQRGQICQSDFSLKSLFLELQQMLAPGYAKQRARTHNSYLQSLASRVDNLKASEKRQKSNRLPIIQLVGTASYASIDRFDSFELRDRVGVDISMPLYSGTIASDEKRAKARLNLAQAEYSRALRLAEQNIDIALGRLKSLEKQLIHRLETERQMKIRFDSAVIEREAGTKTLQDLIEIRLEYESAGLARIDTQYNIERQFLNLLEQVGILN